MFPIFLLGSAVFVSLQLAQSYLSHEKYALEAKARIEQLEIELNDLHSKQQDNSVLAATGVTFGSGSIANDHNANESGGTRSSTSWWRVW